VRGATPDVVVSSPARRAVETASLVAGATAFAGTLRTERRLYDQGVEGLAAVLRDLGSDVVCALVVGHDPAISRFLERIGGAHVGLPPGGLAELVIEGLEWSQIELGETRAQRVRLWRPHGRGHDGRDQPQQSRGRAGTKWFSAAADERVFDAAARAVAQKLEVVLARLAAVADASEEEGEAVRKLRVATRRAEAALRTFRDVLPRRATTRVRAHLRAVRDATNAARDADVLLSRLAALAPPAVVAELRADRHTAQHEVRALCRRLSGDAELARSMAALLRKLRDRRGNDATAMPAFGDCARARLTRSARRFFATVVPDPADVDQLHALRLRTKKLRYEIEILAGVLPIGVRDEAYPLLSELQDRLGDVNDCAVLSKRLRELARSMSAAIPAGSFDVLLREADAMLARSRAELAAWWTPERAEPLRRMIGEIA